MSIFCKRCIIVLSLLFACISLSACGPSEEEKRQAQYQQQREEEAKRLAEFKLEKSEGSRAPF